MNRFWQWWQHIPSHIDPVMISIGNFQIHWYAMMYVVAFGVTYVLVRYRLKYEKFEYSTQVIQNFFLWAILGVLLGGRLGYVLFYNLSYFLRNPWEIVLPFTFSNGIEFTGFRGMSYHGGAIGVALAFVILCRKERIGLFKFSELIVPAIPLGYMFGRVGNFINGELYGRITDYPWGMYFPSDPLTQLRHPSQLYEAFFEGPFLFAVLWLLRKRSPFPGFLPALYLIGYGIIRFALEFLRRPDAHLGTIIWFLTAGQILSVFMVVGGIIYWSLARRH